MLAEGPAIYWRHLYIFIQPIFVGFQTWEFFVSGVGVPMVPLWSHVCPLWHGLKSCEIQKLLQMLQNFAIFIDLSIAFYSLNHAAIINKLSHFGTHKSLILTFNIVHHTYTTVQLLLFYQSLHKYWPYPVSFHSLPILIICLIYLRMFNL